MSEQSLVILHATTMEAYRSIRQNGFTISAEPSAGRSMGDVIYGYAYSGGSVAGSLNHCFGVCATNHATHFAVFPLRLDMPCGAIYFFNQPEWDAFMDAHPGATNYDATVAVCGPHMADAARAILQRDLALRFTPEKAEEYRRRWGPDTPLPSDLNIKPDHISLAAQERGYQAFYMRGTSIITFFDPARLRGNPAWITGAAPPQLHEGGAVSPMVADMVQFADGIAHSHYQQFLMGEPMTGMEIDVTPPPMGPPQAADNQDQGPPQLPLGPPPPDANLPIIIVGNQGGASSSSQDHGSPLLLLEGPPLHQQEQDSSSDDDESLGTPNISSMQARQFPDSSPGRGRGGPPTGNRSRSPSPSRSGSKS